VVSSSGGLDTSSEHLSSLRRGDRRLRTRQTRSDSSREEEDGEEHQDEGGESDQEDRYHQSIASSDTEVRLMRERSQRRIATR
jgi:hypothetical protein